MSSLTGAAILAMLLAQGPGTPPADPPPTEPANAPTAPAPPATPVGAEVSDPDAPVAVTTRLSPDPSHIGDLLRLEVIAAYPQGFSVNLPIGLDLAPLEVVGVEEGEPESSGVGLRKTFTVTLQYFDVGEAQVPAFPLTYVDLEGSVETLTVPGRKFTVESLLANEVDVVRRPEDPPISLEYPNETAETIIYSGLIALVLGALAMLVWMRWRRREKPVVLPPPVPAHVTALEALDGLAHRRLEMVETGRFQDFYLELTEIAKGYVEGRFGLEALDRTTDEIRRDLFAMRDRIAPLDPDDLVRFLQECDLVKFARFAPPPEETADALGQVRRMVNDTIPRARPAEQSEPSEDTEHEPPAKEVA